MPNTDSIDTSSTTVAVRLCATSPILLSMTPLQLKVFERMGWQQIEDAGPHSLLPNVMDAFLELARRPWWDHGVAGIPDEPPPGPVP